jgi:hypothetical protein
MEMLRPIEASMQLPFMQRDAYDKNAGMSGDDLPQYNLLFLHRARKHYFHGQVQLHILCWINLCQRAFLSLLLCIFSVWVLSITMQHSDLGLLVR